MKELNSSNKNFYKTLDILLSKRRNKIQSNIGNVINIINALTDAIILDKTIGTSETIGLFKFICNLKDCTVWSCSSSSSSKKGLYIKADK